jgi:hypothetical protein
VLAIAQRVADFFRYASILLRGCVISWCNVQARWCWGLMRILRGLSLRCMRSRRDLIAERASVGIRLHSSCGQQSVAFMQNER